MSNWSFQPIFDSPMIVLGMIALLAALLFVLPAFHNLSSKQRWILIGLRFVFILLFSFSLLRPTIVSLETKEQTATLVVMFDTSRSMTVPDAEGGITRWQSQLEAIKNIRSELASFGEEIDVQFFGFDQTSRLIITENDQFPYPDQPTGQQTDIGSSLDSILQDLAGKQIAGVILLSDGAQRVYSPQVELQQVARDLARLGSPLHAVTFGTAIDPDQSRDVAVDSLKDQFSVFVQNELVIRTVVDIRGFANQEVPVQLMIEDATGKQEIVATERIRAVKNQEKLEVEFYHTATVPGQYKLSVIVPTQEGELVTKNNQLSSYLSVLSGGLKILYLEGRVVDRPEQKFLRKAIAKSADMKMDFQWFDQRRRDAWPLDLQTTLRDGKYDVFLLGDLDSTALTEETWETIATEVENGKSLIMLGGFHSFGAGGYYHTAINDVLPIEMQRFERQDFDTPIRDDLHLTGPIEMVEAKSHYLTRLGPADQQAELWKSFPKLPGANKLRGVKPRSVTLLTSTNEEPLLVIGEYGLGRSVAFAADSSWRWALAGKSDLHKRFWRQCILWCARKDELERKDVWVDLSQRRFFPGAKVPFTAGVKDSSGDPIRGATFQATLVQPDGSRTPLSFLPAEYGISGSFAAGELVGDYSIEVEASREGKSLGQGTGKFFVFQQDLELADPSAKPAQMASLAALTSEVGGRTWASEQLPELLNNIKEQPPKTEVEIQTRWTWPESLRDAWINALLLVGILSIEWFLRKRWQMV